ncbi:MAG: tetratricopeptide repeat protein [Deltaproteobacteria bacterium]|nr:tetratricopeptide repeat protein [Deltaproteobacteria bacterium]
MNQETGTKPEGRTKGRRKFLSTDPWATGVIVAALVALILFGYLGLRSLKTGLPGVPDMTITELIKTIEKYPRRFMEEAFRGVRPYSKSVKEAKIYVRRGYVLHRKSRYQEALVEYGKAVKLDPKNHEAYFFRGLTLIKLREYEKATQDFKTVIQLRSDFAEAYDNLAWLHVRRGDWDTGILYLTKSLELKPRNGWAYYNRGRCYLEKEEIGKALEDLRRSCDLGYDDGCKLYKKYVNMQKS